MIATITADNLREFDVVVGEGSICDVFVGIRYVHFMTDQGSRKVKRGSKIDVHVKE